MIAVSLNRLRRIRFVFCISMASFLHACGYRPEAVIAISNEELSQTKTDLGYLGNSRAHRRFEEYTRSQTTGCNGSGTAKSRILISGFGPFNQSQNISGAVVRLLQNPKIWPKFATWTPERMNAPIFKPSDDPGAIGARAVQREVTFENETMDICLVLTSVEWDLASAIVLHEANKFNPDFILMTGYGTHPTGMRIESGALNKASSISGYDSTGRYLAGVNTPESDWIVSPSLGLPESINMTWDPQRIADGIRPKLKRLNLEMERSRSATEYFPLPMTEADPLNNYICNNISYTIAASLRLATLPLAGNRLRLESKLNPNVGLGFAHYPHQANPNSSQEVWLWAHVALSLAQTALNN